MVIVVAVFPEIHALPGAEGESAMGDRYGEVHGGEGGAHVGGHVVGALIIMLKHWVAVGADARHETFQITPHAGSAFSCMTSEALVCCRCKVAKPVVNPACSTKGSSSWVRS